MTTTMPAPTTEAVILCSALAWKANFLAGLDLDPTYAHRIITATQNTHTTNEILQWRAHTEPESWTLRWGWARRIMLTHFADTPGVTHLPADHHDALNTTQDISTQ